VSELDWMDDGNCVGVEPDIFFPGRGEVATAAKELCRECPVRVTCLEFALAHGEKWGIWGGKSERERRRIRKERKRFRDAA
jgi:WhiB family redox-sensing transcriptional regulator